MAPPPTPADFSGFGCDPPRTTCVVHGIAARPGGGFAVFQEVGVAAGSGLRGEGVTILVDASGSARRIVPGVVVLSGEFEASGRLRALVEPQWDFEAGALDTRVTDGPAIVELTPEGDVAWIDRLAER